MMSSFKESKKNIPPPKHGVGVSFNLVKLNRKAHGTII
jgi:hypothetical protein